MVDILKQLSNVMIKLGRSKILLPDYMPVQVNRQLGSIIQITE